MRGIAQTEWPLVYKRFGDEQGLAPFCRSPAVCVTSNHTTETLMASRDFVLWEVDVQVDFMLPGGKLYVPGAEKLLPNIRKLTDAARRDKVFMVSHGCFHPPDDPA